MYRNYKNVGNQLIGRGSFAQLEGIITDRKKEENSFVVFIVDDFCREKQLAKKIPLTSNDLIYWQNVDEEPTTLRVDEIVADIKAKKSILPTAIIGIGGGSAMDYSKAVKLMLTNPGSSSLYQGLDLIKNPGVYNIVVPTLSGTGAEVSMTAVLTGPEKKLGLKCNFTPPDQVILDADLIQDAPEPQRFYTAMDCYIHNVEALNGTWKNTLGISYGEISQKLCKEVFLSDNPRSPENDEKLMIASYFGGLSITHSQVGACHAISYGLSFVGHVHHGIANCLVFNQLEEFYPEDVIEFKKMLEINKITLPVNYISKFTPAQIEQMIDISITLEFMWDHLCGKDWRKIITRDKLRNILMKI